ncbi:4-hydroxy-tetrahydrodipicolinate synthase [Priestia filamentosa]|uniref:4-hydroxy-tetrahydrodipicolinate synthase n=1 Tax=Priestia filamentosa TaxID=1402861 RepID=UPI002E1FDF28|nr:4-hydroxy-tetrahydrodipicolinate synthase [Priestia filamentosa]MED3724848.1 4-hydroxy-tetrahydrodipicolinate synthase [Priestia filamentosa]
MYKPFGMIPALPTPFREDNTIDFEGLEQNLNYVIEGGVQCVLISGSAGEYSLMNMEERKSLIKFVCEKAQGRVSIMAGTSCHRTEDTIELSRYAAESGVDYALVLPPYYMKTSKQGVYEYYKTVAERSNIGIVIYHYPEGTNVELSPEQIYELSQIDGVVGVKNTADQLHTCKLIELTKDNKNFSVLTGYEQLILPTLAVGGAGAVGLAMNLVPKEYVKLYDSFVSGNNLEEAIQLNQSLTQLIDLLEEELPPGAVKAGLDMIGLTGGKCRSPLEPASEELKTKVQEKLNELGYSAKEKSNIIEAPEGRFASKQTAFSEIPMIDIEALVDGSDPEGVARTIGKACEEVGFFYVKNHGVPQDLIDRMYQATKQFFELPAEVKERLHVANSGQTLRGYIPPYGENADPKNTRDLKEAFDYGAHTEEVSPFFGPNPMPEELPGFKEVCEEYHDAMMSLARKLVSAFAISLDLPADYFEQLQRQPITIERLLHYPSQKANAAANEIGIGAHSDYGFLTILSQDSVGGLQVRNKEGEWISAPPVEGSYIINIGDLVQAMTNGRYSSTVHRVVNTSGVARYSIPFFIDLDYDAVVETLPTCVDAENPATENTFTCGEYKYARFVDVYPHLQEPQKENEPVS